MKAIKTLAIATAMSAATLSATAGGYLTNTNQSIHFLRNPSLDGYIGIDAYYNNPAGCSFLAPGFHLSLNLQNAYQNRNVTTTFAPFALGRYNLNNPTKEFKGKALAPVIPSLQATYNTENWAFGFAFGIVGGGGKCTFDQGLPSFESSVSVLPMVGQQLGLPVTGYDFDTYMKGRNYQFGFQLGASRKITDNLSVYGGLRLIYATNNYYGYIKNMKMELGGNGVYLAPSTILQQVGEQKQKEIMAAVQAGLMTPEQAMAAQQELNNTAMMVNQKTADIELNCNQTGFGVTPIIGVDWKINEHWNVAAKYEFKTRLRLKNVSANVNTEGHGLDAYEDGKKVAEDIPAIVTAGVQYSPIQSVRINAGYHYYFDKQATKAGNANKLLDGGTWEITAGAEYDITNKWTVSAGWQTTNYPNTDAYMKDVSFATNSNSFGVGVKYQINKKVAVEAAYFQTIYNTYERNQADYNNISASIGAPINGKDCFDRSNRVIGVGVTLDL